MAPTKLGGAAKLNRVIGPPPPAPLHGEAGGTDDGQPNKMVCTCVILPVTCAVTVPERVSFPALEAGGLISVAKWFFPVTNVGGTSGMPGSVKVHDVRALLVSMQGPPAMSLRATPQSPTDSWRARRYDRVW